MSATNSMNFWGISDRARIRQRSAREYLVTGLVSPLMTGAEVVEVWILNSSRMRSGWPGSDGNPPTSFNVASVQ